MASSEKPELYTIESIASAKSKASELKDTANRRSTKKKQELELWKDDQRQTALLRFGIISNVSVERYIQRKLRTSKLGARDRLYQFMYSPSSSGAALGFAFTISCCNLASGALHALHSLSPWDEASDESTHGRGLEAAHIALTTVYVGELLLRMVAAPSWKVVVYDSFFWLDMACMIPILVRIGRYPDPLSSADAALRLFVRFLEALGPLRLLKMCRFYHNAALLVAAVVNTLGALPVPLFFLFLLCTSGGSLVYAFEQECIDAVTSVVERIDDVDYDHPSSGLSGVGDVLFAWVNMITLTTVGYVYPGFAPSTPGGRAVVAIVSLVGVAVVAMALHIVGHTFGEVFEARKIALVKAGLKRVMVAHGVSNNDVFEAFAQFDVDKNGTIDYNEVCGAGWKEARRGSEHK